MEANACEIHHWLVSNANVQITKEIELYMLTTTDDNVVSIQGFVDFLENISTLDIKIIIS